MNDEIVFHSDNEGNYIEPKKPDGTFKPEYQNTYIAEQRRKKYRGHFRQVFSLYRQDDRKKPPILIKRIYDKKRINQGFQANIDYSTGFRKYRKVEFSKNSRIIVTDRPLKITNKERDGTINIRYPQIVAKCLVSDEEDIISPQVILGYSETISNARPSPHQINNALEQCKIYAVDRFIEKNGLVGIGRSEDYKKNVNYTAQIMAWRFQYWKTRRRRKTG